MSSNKCALCDCAITQENDSMEHLIPNSIGGRKKISGFICIDCNSKTGNDWDSELAKQLNHLSLLLGITRERGEVPSQIVETTTGKKFRQNADGSLELEKPLCKIMKHDDNNNLYINVEARSQQEAEKMLRGLRRKYSFNIDEALINAKPQKHYPDGMLKLEIQLEDHKSGRSIVKSALALAADSGIDSQSCENAKKYLTQKDSEPCFGYYYEHDLVKNRPIDTIFHCVAIVGIPETKLLIGYVEYYSFHRMIICLSDKYDGKSFSKTYAINPINGREIDLEIEFNPIPDDIKAVYQYKKNSEEVIKQAYEKVILAGLKKSFELEKARVIKEAVEYAFKNCGAKEGELLTEEHFHKLAKLSLEKIEPFFIHMAKHE